ncbi:pseudouridine synthase [Candidatus Geothermarchaeota archaeon ex4572_27]|nr:MAG: pseudouridine synthase [Candidatus Geothermarchaeota archaeon ex4572_27]
MLELLRRVRAVADYQFGRGVGGKLFPDDVEIQVSPRTGRVRRIYLGGRLLATLRPSDGLLALTIEGGRRLQSILPPPSYRVVVHGRYGRHPAQGRNVLARFVKSADPNIRPGEEVLVVDERDQLLAVGKAVMAGDEMARFRSGVAVKVRHGVGWESL